MGYVVTIHVAGIDNKDRPWRQYWVLQPSGAWTNRLKDDILKPPPEGTGSAASIKIFGTKEEADAAKARIEGGDRLHGPDPAGTVNVEHVDAMPHHPKCPSENSGNPCLCGLYRDRDRLREFVEFVRKSHVGHDVEKGCTTGICKEIERLEKEGLVSKR